MAFMENKNHSNVTHFILLGFSSDSKVETVIFLIFLVFYVVILVANILLILVVFSDHRLHNPMYFFLVNLSIINICGPSAIIPRMLVDFVSGNKSIVVAACVTQIFFSFVMVVSECLLLVFMAYDRYVAICKPFHYSRILKRSVCALMITATWTVSFATSSFSIFFLCRLTFCGSNIINHFMCSLPTVMLLSCSDTSVLDFMISFGGATILLVPLLLILFSYYKIISSIKGIRSRRYKAFSSCAPHLIIVTLHYQVAVIAFMRPKVFLNDSRDKVRTFFYVIIIPVLNPMIYSLRNKDVIRALRLLVRLQK